MSTPGVDPRTPVIVGVGVAQQCHLEVADALEAPELMDVAARRAAADACAHPEALLRAVDLISVPKGLWSYTDPARTLQQHWGATAARTALFGIGVLQPSLISDACARILDGSVRTAVVVGGEAKFRHLRGQIAGSPAPETPSPGDGPDIRVEPSADIVHPVEVQRGLMTPARQYAIIDCALRGAQGLTPSEHAQVLADLWASFSAVAVGNPDAWNRVPVTSAELLGTETNPLLAYPYTKLHCSQWNVDQAAAFVITSYANALELGGSPERFVYPWAIVESNFMAPLVQRAQMHRSAAVEHVGRALAAALERPLDSVEHLDLYSCFPAAVRVQLEEFGIDPAAHEALTVTGGMTFGGGPLNNYTFQALARLCEALRAAPTATAIGTAVSGMLTKFGAWAWSCKPSPAPVALVDVTEAVAASTALVDVDAGYRGDAHIAGYTVAHDRGAPSQAIAIVDTPQGLRTVATSQDAEAMAQFMTRDMLGAPCAVDDGALTGW